MKLGVIIAAGGIGSRMGAGSSKQLLKLAGQPVLARTIAIFEELPEVAEITVAIDEKDIEEGRRLVSGNGFRKVTAVVAGGDYRAASVIQAFAALSPAIDTVAIHDGARPLFPGELLRRGLDELAREPVDGLVFGIPVHDTIKEIDPETGAIYATPDRRRLWAAQTPQIFKRAILEKAFAAEEEILKQATDDSSLVELIGGQVIMVIGSRFNIKITEPGDMLLAESIIESALSDANAGDGTVRE